jgi:cell wall-associated NlpC family hydrolase
MNCWEFVLFAAYKAGLITKNDVDRIQSAATDAAASSGDANQYFSVIKERLGFGNNGKWTPNVALLPGDLVFFDGIDHVAIATGNIVAGGKHEVISLWLLPVTPDRQHLDSNVQRTTIENILSDDQRLFHEGAMDVRFAESPWRR